MGILTRLSDWWSGAEEIGAPAKRSTDPNLESLLWGASLYSTQSVTGISINQYTALNATPVIAAVTMLAEDVAKLPWSIYEQADGEAKKEARSHFLYDLLQEPNEWQDDFEFREQLQIGLIMRGNAYAPIIRSARGQPIRLVPVNPDWCALWEAPNGDLFYRVTPQGLHMRAVLNDDAFFRETGMFRQEDMLHIRGFSSNGLLGAARIALAREAIALSLAQEQTAARWMGNGSRPSGVLSTDQKLTKEAAERIAADWKQLNSGLQNSGKTVVLEQGLKFDKLQMTASDLEFIASRKFQVEEIARLFRIPQHMMGVLERSTNNNIAQQAQEYINYTLTGYTNRWKRKLSQHFGLRKQGLTIEFDYRELTTADIGTRVNNWRTMIMSMIAKPDEARIDLGMQPVGGDADKLHYPQNMATQGSQSTGTAPEDAGRPSSTESPV